MPRAVLLDALGTLLELEPPGPALRRALRDRGAKVSAEEAERAMAAEIAYYRAHHDEGRNLAGLVGLRRGCALAVADALPPDVGRRLGPDGVRAAMLEALRFEPYREVGPVLAGLRHRGVRLVVVSNWDCSLHEVLASHGLAMRVHGVVTSAELGAAKPARAIFAHALTLAGVPASDAIHVGDRLEEDVQGARSAGIEPVLLVRHGDPPAGARGVRTIRSLRELADLAP